VAPAPASPSVRAKTILIVDSEDSTRELLEILFSKCGYETLTAADSVTAMTLAAQSVPSVALVDHRVSGGGASLISGLRRQYPEIRSIFMTAHRDPQFFEAASRAGARDAIRKPFELSELVAKVQRQIEEKEKDCPGSEPS
jgi:two-component system KDP operon response regulator KdpE